MNMLHADTVLRFSPVASMQSLGDGAVVLLADSGQLYTCNETTEAVLKLVDGQRSLGEIIDVALERYETSRATLEEDFTAIALELVQEGVLQA